MQGSLSEESLPTPVPGRTRRREKTRARILAFARQVFLERGFRKVTVDEICAGLGISKRTFYRHFVDRDALAVEVVAEIVGKLSPPILENLISDKPVDLLLKTHFELLADRLLANVSTQLLMDVQTFLPEVWERIETVRVGFIRILADQLRRGQSEGTIRTTIDAQATGKLIEGVVNSLGNPAFLVGQDLTVGQFVRTFQNLLLHGVLQPHPGESANEPEDRTETIG